MKNGEHTVLIIDDQKSIRCLLGSFLKNQYKIVGFEDGFSAMQWLSNANIPDLILLDLDIPRLPGKDFLEQIRNAGFFREIPVVIISGDESKETKAFCEEQGVDAYLTKPFNPIELNALVKGILTRKPKELINDNNRPILNKLTTRLKKK